MSTRRPLPSPTALQREGAPFTSADVSNLIGRDETAWMSGYVTPDLIVVTEVCALSGDELRSTTLEQAVEQIAASARRVGAHQVLGDQREAGGMTALLRQQGLTFVEVTWSTGSKDRGVQVLRRLLRERRVALPPDPKLRAELLAMRARLQPGGSVIYPHAGDRASCLVTIAIAIAEETIRVSGPLGPDALMPHDGDHDERMRIARAGRFNQRDLPDHLIERRRGGSVFDVSPRGSWK